MRNFEKLETDPILQNIEKLHNNYKSYSRTFINLYHAVNEMMSVLGSDGEINSQHDTVCKVMNALYEIDGGVYKNDGK